MSHGSRLRFLDTPRAYAFFPCLLSDLLRDAVSEGRLRRVAQQHGGRDFNRPATLALRHAEALEADYRRIFLPAVHTFSWDAGWRAAPNVSFTPFPRPAPSFDFAQDASQDDGSTLSGAAQAVHALRSRRAPAPGIYLMPSGVGSAGAASIVQAAAELLAGTAEPLAVYMPPADHPPAAFAAAFPHAVQLPAQHIAHPNIRCVIGRAGWGTLWECLNAGRVFVAIPALPGDDPEIAHNLRTLHATGLALTWETGTASALWQAAGDVQSRIRHLLAAFKAQYGTVDGLEVMARTVLTELQDGLPG